MAIISLTPGILWEPGAFLSGIQGYANGAFTLEVTMADGGRKILLYDRAGKECYITGWARQGAVLNNGCYILFDEKCRHAFAKGVTVSGSNGSGTLYAAGGRKIKEGFEAFEIFANGWYMLAYKEEKQLFDTEHQLKAKGGFQQCAVFDGYYALRVDSVLYPYGNWNLFSSGGMLIRNIYNVARFLGNAQALVYDVKRQELCLERSDGTIADCGTVKAESFPNGRFVLENEKGVAVMCGADGYPMSERSQGAVYLPDGRFVQYEQKMPVGLYRRNGLLDNADVYGIETAGLYYLIRGSQGTFLFNDKGENLGSGYTLLKSADNFALFEAGEKAWLFNQFGAIWQMPV